MCALLGGAAVAPGDRSADETRPGAPTTVPLASAPGARVVDERWINSRMLDLIVFSPAVGDRVPVRLLLPRDWHERADAKWPTLYLLNGFNDPHGYTAWTAYTDVAEFMGEKNVLTVLPGGGKVGSFTNWWNDSRYGPPAWEAFHTRELPRLLESTFRAGDRRAIAGISLGGYGAMKYAANRPRMYGTAAAYSSPLHITQPAIAQMMRQMLRRAGIDPDRVWGDPLLQDAVWRANDPWWSASRLRGTRVFLSTANGVPGRHSPPATERVTELREQPTGTAEETSLASGLELSVASTTYDFEQRLASLGIQATTDHNTRGTHGWKYWQDALHESWPSLAAGLGVAPN